MGAVATGDFESLGKPLRRNMHGGPGTGKTHIIIILKEELFQTALKRTVGT